MDKIYLFNQVPFNPVTTIDLINKIALWVKRGDKKLILYMNTHGVVTFLKNQAYAKVFQAADLIYPDGWGPVYASWLLLNPLPERVNVGDFIEDLLKTLSNKRIKIFLLGCDNNVVRMTANKITQQYPGLHVCGRHHGFFNKKEEGYIIKQLHQLTPQLVLVGMGIPTQELWLHKHWLMLPDAVYMGVGGVFYYISGTKSRAPNWMRKTGLEWAYRFYQEPKRLWGRYTADTMFFLGTVMKYLIINKLLRRHPPGYQKS